MDLNRNYRIVLNPNNIPHDSSNYVTMDSFIDSFTNLYNSTFNISITPIIVETGSTNTKQYLYPLFEYDGSISDFFYISILFNVSYDYPEKATSFRLQTVHKETDNSYIVFGNVDKNYNLMDSSSSGGLDFYYMSKYTFNGASYIGLTIFPTKSGYLFSGFADRRGSSSQTAAEKGVSSYNILFNKCNLDDDNKTISTVALYSDGKNIVKNVSRQINPSTNKIVNGAKQYANATNYGMTYGVMEKYIGNILTDDVYVLSMASGDMMQVFNQTSYSHQLTPYVKNKLLINDKKYCFTTYGATYRLAFLFEGKDNLFPYNSEWKALTSVPGTLLDWYFMSDSDKIYFLSADSHDYNYIRVHNHYIYDGNSWSEPSQISLPQIYRCIAYNNELYIIYITNESPRRMLFAKMNNYEDYIVVPEYTSSNAATPTLCIYNNELYLILYRSGSSGWIHFYKYNGTGFDLITDSFPNISSNINSTTEHDDGCLYVNNKNTIFKYDGNSWTTFASLPFSPSSGKFGIISCDGYIHCILVGTSTTYRYVYDGSWVRLYDYPGNILAREDKNSIFLIKYNEKITTLGSSSLYYLE